MTYTIVSAKYANPDGTAATLFTQEAGAVLVSQRDTPALWDAMLASTTPEPYAVVSVESRQEAMWGRIKAHRDHLSDHGGYPVMVGSTKKWFHSDPKSKTQQIGLVLLGASVPPIPWKTMDGTFVPMTQAIALGILQSGMQQDSAIFAAAEIHKSQMLAMAEPESYDFRSGWPEMYGTG